MELRERTAETPSATLEPVYEDDESAILGQRLVLTPYMLLDQLKRCQEQSETLIEHIHRNGIGVEQKCGLRYNPVAERLEDIHFTVSQVLRLLWRSGLWTDERLETATDADGRQFYALRKPFTDGKPHGRPLTSDAPEWQRELLGVPADCPEPAER